MNDSKRPNSAHAIAPATSPPQFESPINFTMTWCGACGVQFALPTIVFQQRGRDGLGVFCPCCGNAGLCEAPAEDVLGQLQQKVLNATHQNQQMKLALAGAAKQTA